MTAKQVGHGHHERREGRKRSAELGVDVLERRDYHDQHHQEDAHHENHHDRWVRQCRHDLALEPNAGLTKICEFGEALMELATGLTSRNHCCGHFTEQFFFLAERLSQ